MKLMRMMMIGLTTLNGEPGMEWVLVYWSDITSCAGPWVTEDEIRELTPTLMISAGVVIKDNSSYLVLAGTIDTDDSDGRTYGDVNVIPVGVISDIRLMCDAGGQEYAEVAEDDVG